MSTSLTRLPSMVEVPRPITDKLSNVMQRQQSQTNVFRWSGWLALVMLALLSMVGCDLYFEFDSLLSRLSGWFLALLGVALFGWAWQRFAERPLNWLEAAWRVESLNPQLDERLSSTIELIGEQNQNPQQANGRYSNQLLSALSQEATRASSTINPEDVPVRSNGWVVSAAVAVVTMFLCLTIINPSGVGCSLRNWLLPWAEPIFPQLSIELTPGEVTLVQGEPLTVQAPTLAARIDAILERISGTTTSATPFDNANIRSAKLLDLQEDSTYRLRIGKRISREYPIRVLAKPQIQNHVVQVQFPDYTAVATETYTNSLEPILALHGSTVTIRLDVDPHARLAELTWEDPRGQKMTANDFRFEIRCDEVGTRTAKLRVLSSENIPSESILVTLEVLADLPPTIQILDPTIPRFYLPRERELPIQFAVQDDFGIQRVELIYEAVGREQLGQHSFLAKFDRLPNEVAAAYHGQAFVTFNELPADCRAAKVWLRTIDNRGESLGGPQSIESDSLLIEFQPIDSTPLEQRLAAEQQEIQQALDEARQALEQAQTLTEQLTNEQLTDDFPADETQKPWEAARDKITDSQKSLERLAEKIEQSNSDLSEQAQAARDMADESMVEAQRQLERGQRMDEAENQAAAQESAKQAQAQVQETLEQLEQLEKSLEEKAQQLETAAKLEDLARQQEKLANELATSNEASGEEKQNERDTQAMNEEAADSEPKSTDEDWRQRQQQVANELAALQEQEQPETEQQDTDAANATNNATPEQQGLLDQAEQANRLAERARELADRLEQPVNDEQQEQVAKEKQQELIQEIKELQQQVEQMAQQERERQQEQQQEQQPAGLEEAQQHLEQAKQQLEQEAQDTKQDPQDLNRQNGQQGQEQQDLQQDQDTKQDPQDPNRENGQQGQQGQKQQQAQQPKSPAEKLRQAADALQKNCEACRECANCQNPSGNGGKSSGQPKSQKLAEARKDCDDAAQAPAEKQAEQHAKQAAQKLSELAQQAAQEAGLRKNCEKCKKPGDGQSEAMGKSGSSPIGTKSVTDDPFERLPLRGETSSGWTRAKRQLRNGVLDGREALIPESFRDVVTEYFEALAKDGKDSD